jgi:hypothetical protein
MGRIVDNDRLERLALALNTRMKDAIAAEEERARLAESELQETIDDIEAMMGGKTIVYLTQLEFDALTDEERDDENIAYFITDAEEYDIWVGTTEELEAIVDRDPNTIYFELDEDGKDNVVYPLTITEGVVQLTNDRYQKVSDVPEELQILFPTVESDQFTEVSLFFTADNNVNLIFPENCKWRVDPNIEKGKAYEIECKFNTMLWLVNVVSYS